MASADDIGSWYHEDMAMTLRLPDETQALLKHYAEEEGVSAHAAAVTAITDWLERKQREEIRSIARKVLEEDAELLHRLGTA
jgi:predicted transcriptional regulator